MLVGGFCLVLDQRKYSPLTGRVMCCPTLNSSFSAFLSAKENLWWENSHLCLYLTRQKCVSDKLVMDERKQMEKDSDESDRQVLTECLNKGVETAISPQKSLPLPRLFFLERNFYEKNFTRLAKYCSKNPFMSWNMFRKQPLKFFSFMSSLQVLKTVVYCRHTLFVSTVKAWMLS